MFPADCSLKLVLEFDDELTKDLSGLPEGICMLEEHARIPWRMQCCFHYSPYKQVETMDNLLRKHLPCMAACIISNS